jgi:hypothetical protein
MNVSICLDQYASNYNLNALSSNGFNIYTDLDNFTTPIAQGIPYQNLFSAPIGNCPYLLTNVPSGALQLLVIDNCTSNPTLPGATIPTSQELLIDCCYALIDIQITPPAPPTTSSFCTTCSLDFNVFSSSYVGQIIAGNLNSTCGSVTDYTIGWYKDGDYSSPEFVSGYGNAFVPYQLTHPLAGNTAPYVTAGDWEGIIHDIAINGVTYSSVSGSAGGQPIPFESCFGTIVVAPLECGNGTFPGIYSHQKTFTAAGNGAPPPVISTTYQLSSSTEYFAYSFQGYTIWDELEIKFISGDPNNTGNPSLYSQPIYLEKIRIGSDNNPNNIGTLNTINNNTYPKQLASSQPFKRVLTLTNISRSANPSLPDVLDIKITPNPTNNQTNWNLKMQCLDTFDCTDCLDSFPKIKLSDIVINKYCCSYQVIGLTKSASCDGSQMLWDNKILQVNPYSSSQGYTLGYGELEANYTPSGNTNTTSLGFSYQTPSNCTTGVVSPGSTACSPVTPNSTIKYHKSTTTVNGQTQGIISMSFNNQIDYTFYKDKIIYGESTLITNMGPITFDPTNINYYAWYQLTFPANTTPCGDGVSSATFPIHRTAYPNIIYVEDPTNNYWSITIPMPLIQNQYPQSTCSNCSGVLNQLVDEINSFSLTYYNNLNVINSFGSKFSNPISSIKIPLSTPSSYAQGYGKISSMRTMPIYSFKTLPFVSSSAGWVNLPTLEAVPCPTLVSSSMPYIINGYNQSAIYRGTESEFLIYFPNLTGSSEWFQIYTNVTSSNGYIAATTFGPPPPIPSNLIYEYTASVGTVYSSSYFVGVPTVTINNLC